jgi:hypothetical protein
VTESIDETEYEIKATKLRWAMSDAFDMGRDAQYHKDYSPITDQIQEWLETLTNRIITDVLGEPDA